MRNIIHKSPILYLVLLVMMLSITCTTSKNSQSGKDNSSTSGYSSDFYKKYSKILGVELTGKEDKNFITAVAAWLGTPYLYGGESKKGTDCSGFVQTLYQDVYHIKLNRTAADLEKDCEHVSKNNLKPGDLVFFKIKSKTVSHVGIYLCDGKFVHASSSKGVVVSNLNDEYYAKYYYSAGRVKKGEK